MSDKPQISRAPIALSTVESSQIHAIGHDPATNTLAVQFKDKEGGPGSLYHYSNFDAEEFEHFKGAESIGSHFYKNIKPNATTYPYARIETDPEQA
ncbi:KTSC domain-containing protein [Paraburkholderia sp. C35]|uniref:KTSC domain-containing protein n=1 Tax=Paraburkholderia sp. C35 TaxID=2126993 RepID=UPI000D69993A|nr:KTSC domain-containing protein [Paraburkholderia sp. C35]